MRRALALLCLCASPGAQQIPAEAARRAFVELEVARTRAFVHEPIRVLVRFGVDVEWFDAHALQPFQRPLDVPVQIGGGGLHELPGARPLPEPVADSDSTEAPVRQSFALDDGLGWARLAAERWVDGRRFVVREIERRWLPLAPGELVCPAPRLLFAYATRFEEDFLDGRRAVDRHEVLVDGEPLVLSIDPLPEEGRPPEFSGVVGRLTLAAEAQPRTLAVGESLTLLLHLEGDLATLQAPRLDELLGFDVLGRLEEGDAWRRTLRYDLAPRSEAVREVPAIVLASFDPEPPAGYRRIATPPIPLRVHPAPEAARSEPEAGGARAAGEFPPALRVAAVLGVLLLLSSAFALLAAARARRAADSDPARARRRAAAVAAAVRALEQGADPASALTDFLAALLSIPSAAVIARDLEARLTAAGLGSERAARAATLLDALVAARYGGHAQEGGAEAVGRLVDELSRSAPPAGLAR